MFGIRALAVLKQLGKKGSIFDVTQISTKIEYFFLCTTPLHAPLYRKENPPPPTLHDVIC